MVVVISSVPWYQAKDGVGTGIRTHSSPNSARIQGMQGKAIHFRQGRPKDSDYLDVWFRSCMWVSDQSRIRHWTQSMSDEFKFPRISRTLGRSKSTDSTSIAPGSANEQRRLSKVIAQRLLENSAQLALLQNEVREHGLSTKTDHERLERAIKALYARSFSSHSGLDGSQTEAPRIIWFDSACEMYAAAALLVAATAGRSRVSYDFGLTNAANILSRFVTDQAPPGGWADEGLHLATAYSKSAPAEEQQHIALQGRIASIEVALESGLSIDRWTALWAAFGAAVSRQIGTNENIEAEPDLLRPRLIIDPDIMSKVAEKVPGELFSQSTLTEVVDRLSIEDESSARSWFHWDQVHSPVKHAREYLQARAFEIIGLIPTPKDDESTHCNDTYQCFINTVQAGGWWFPFKNFCLACEGPSEIHVNDQLQLHNDNGPAVVFGDEYKVWALNRVLVTEDIVLRRFSAKDIDEQPNLEVRQLMLQRFGLERYVSESGLHEIQRDEFGVLYKKDFADDESLVMVQVSNSTPEENGERREYFLRVPPNITTARQGIAWTFGLEELEYHPLIES